MLACSTCGGRVEDEFRFCPHCGASLRTKIVECFRGHPEVGDGGLRVSVYLTEPRHARLSVWRGDEAQATISLDPHESGRLGRFLLSVTKHREQSFVSRVLARL
jgi:zinc ribbon protein